MPKPFSPSPPQVKSLIFDQSGTYLALGGTDVQIYICKQWTEILHFTGAGRGAEGGRGSASAWPSPNPSAAFPPQSTAASPRAWLSATTPSSSPPRAWTGASSSTACRAGAGSSRCSAGVWGGREGLGGLGGRVRGVRYSFRLPCSSWGERGS